VGLFTFLTASDRPESGSGVVAEKAQAFMSLVWVRVTHVPLGTDAFTDFFVAMS
jgi:hypothetical protein